MTPNLVFHYPLPGSTAGVGSSLGGGLGSGGGSIGGMVGETETPKQIARRNHPVKLGGTTPIAVAAVSARGRLGSSSSVQPANQPPNTDNLVSTTTSNATTAASNPSTATNATLAGTVDTSLNHSLNHNHSLNLNLNLSHSHSHTHPHSHSHTLSLSPIQKDDPLLLGFHPQLVGDILSPKMALCDRIFKLMVDNLVFVGHPTLLNADRPGTGHRFARQIQRKQLSEQEAAAEVRESAVIDPEDLDFQSTAAASAAAGLAISITAQTTQTLTLTHTPTMPLTQNTVTTYSTPSGPYPVRSRTFSISLGGPTPSPHMHTPLSAAYSSPAIGTTAGSAVPPGGGGGGSGNINPSFLKFSAPTTDDSQQLQLSMFNLILIVSKDDNEDTLDNVVDYVYKNIIAKLTAGLKYEQLKRGYLKKEIEVIMGIRDKLHNGAGTFIKPETMTTIMEESSLARLLAHTYHSIVSGTPHIHLDLNSSINISIRIDRKVLKKSSKVQPTGEYIDSPIDYEPPTLDDQTNTTIAANNIARKLNEYEDDNVSRNRWRHLDGIPPLRPYHAILLLNHAEDLIKSLPADSAPLLHDLIKTVTPTQSLDVLAFALNCSLAQIYRLGAVLSHLESEFRVKDLDFGQILSEMCYARPLNTSLKHIPHLEIVALFLRYNLIEQFRQN
ncbi:Nitrogen permease regulator 3 [Physocladia obscura]|uniref:Nitrogen permease regulator 3 n=1 Tax=Physocladia obscura TaxID=109957 RepID=A0AAD5XK46_9FUNG|nr:Nitrogen permease regulator 3 [Physocladia obscura]